MLVSNRGSYTLFHQCRSQMLIAQSQQHSVYMGIFVISVAHPVDGEIAGGYQYQGFLRNLAPGSSIDRPPNRVPPRFVFAGTSGDYARWCEQVSVSVQSWHLELIPLDDSCGSVSSTPCLEIMT